MTAKHFPDFRRATPATWKSSYKYKKISLGKSEFSTEPATEGPAPVLAGWIWPFPGHASAPQFPAAWIFSRPRGGRGDL